MKGKIIILLGISNFAIIVAVIDRKDIENVFIRQKNFVFLEKSFEIKMGEITFAVTIHSTEG